MKNVSGSVVYFSAFFNMPRETFLFSATLSDDEAYDLCKDRINDINRVDIYANNSNEVMIVYDYYAIARYIYSKYTLDALKKHKELYQKIKFYLLLK
jgi:hypothetical protein